MKAIILNAINTPLNMTELPKPEKKEGEKTHTYRLCGT
jgi:hypothetical protein